MDAVLFFCVYMINVVEQSERCVVRKYNLRHTDTILHRVLLFDSTIRPEEA